MRSYFAGNEQKSHVFRHWFMKNETFSCPFCVCVYDWLYKHAVISSTIGKIRAFLLLVILIFSQVILYLHTLFNKCANISRKLSKPMLFQDWFPNYGIYCGLFLNIQSSFISSFRNKALQYGTPNPARKWQRPFRISESSGFWVSTQNDKWRSAKSR